MELNQLKQFTAIVECQTMRAAAEELGLAQPSISQSIKRLEKELDCKLFERQHNKMQLLDYGKILYAHAKNAFEELDMAVAEIEEERIRRSTTLRIGCYSNAFAANVFPQLAFERPELSIEAAYVPADELFRSFDAGQYDAIVFPVMGDSIDFGHKLVTEQLVLSVPHTSCLARWSEIEISRLAEHRLFVADDFPGYSDWYQLVLERASCDPSKVEFAHSRDYLARMDRQEKPHFSTDFLQAFLGRNSRRSNVRISSDLSRRTLCYALRDERHEVLGPAFREMAKTLRVHDLGSAYIPFRVYPGFINNLTITAK